MTKNCLPRIERGQGQKENSMKAPFAYEGSLCFGRMDKSEAEWTLK